MKEVEDAGSPPESDCLESSRTSRSGFRDEGPLRLAGDPVGPAGSGPDGARGIRPIINREPAFRSRNSRNDPRPPRTSPEPG